MRQFDRGGCRHAAAAVGYSLSVCARCQGQMHGGTGSVRFNFAFGQRKGLEVGKGCTCAVDRCTALQKEREDGARVWGQAPLCDAEPAAALSQLQ